MKVISDESFDRIYRSLIQYVFDNGIESSPRGMPIYECLGVSFILTDPTSSFCNIKERKLNKKFATVEMFEYISGDSDPDRLCSYNKNMRNFINEETGEFDGAYAPRIGRQLNWVFKLLLRDPDTRQAVININNEGDKRETKDVPCTVDLQFFIRERKLHLIAHMRSNDLLWGTPYDVNAFCFIQRMVHAWLKNHIPSLELGSYIHFAGSLHIYKEREDQLRKLLGKVTYNRFKHPDIDLTSSIDRGEFFKIFWDCERRIRTIKGDQIWRRNAELLPNYMKKYLELISS